MSTKVRVVSVVGLRLAVAASARSYRRHPAAIQPPTFFAHKLDELLAVAHPTAQTGPLTFSTLTHAGPGARNELATFCRVHGLGFEEREVSEQDDDGGGARSGGGGGGGAGGRKPLARPVASSNSSFMAAAIEAARRPAPPRRRGGRARAAGCMACTAT